MILIILVVGCLVSVPLTGGRLRSLADLPLRYAWTALLAIGLQVIITTIAPGGSHGLHAAIHVFTYGLIGAFLWANRRLPGVPVVAAGALANAVAIVANVGVMPTWAVAQRLAGLKAATGFQNSSILAHPHVLWLGDVIPVPGPLPNVLSLGDCLIYGGLLLLLHRTCRASARASSASQQAHTAQLVGSE
jgi:hypothetical protein